MSFTFKLYFIFYLINTKNIKMKKTSNNIENREQVYMWLYT